MHGARRVVVWSGAFLLLLGAAVTTKPQAGQAPQAVTGTAGVADQRSVVDFQELAARETAAPAAAEAPRAIHSPRSPRGEKAPPQGLVTTEEPGAEAAVEAGAGAADSPAPVANFLALEDNGTAIPPDTHGSAGPNHLMVTLNTQVRIQNKTGGTISTVTLRNFWASLGNPDPFDPRVFYDAAGGRWIFGAVANAELSSAAVLIGVSQTNDPTGMWSLYKVAVDPAGLNWADFPTIGYNKNWIAVQVNIFTNAADRFVRSQTYAFNKSNLYAGGAGTFTLLQDNTGGFTSCPAQTFDSNLSTLYLVEDWNGNAGGSGFLRVSTITGAVGSEVLTPVAFPSTPNPWAEFAAANFAPQAGSVQKIATNDARIYSVVYRNGSLWATHAVFYPAAAPTRSAVQVWELDATNFSVKQRITIDDATGQNFHAFPSLAVNKNNDVLVGYNRFSASSFASAFYSFRASTDASNTLQSPQLLKAGEAPYFKTFGGTENRWGDYSNTSVDPTNDTDFWTIQEYAATPSGGSDRWGTWWGKVAPGGAPPPSATWVITMSKATYVTGDTITATTFGPKLGASNATARIQVTIKVPTLGTFTLIDVGSDGSLTLPANLNVNLGPMSLITVTGSFPPRGSWSLDSKVTNPTTGVVIDTDVNPFVVQ